MAGTSIGIEVRQLAEAEAIVAGMLKAGQNLFPLNLAIAQTQMQSSKRRFKTQTAPDGSPWTPSKAALKRKDPSRPTLVDTRHFVDTTFSAEATETEARWGSSAKQARIFQLGGTITMPARQGNVRLRTNPDGSLMRQGSKGSLARLARFARAGHKRARAVDFKAKAYTINVIARPFLGLDDRDRGEIITLARDHFLRRSGE